MDTTGSAPVGAHPLVAAVVSAQELLAEAASDACWSLSDGEVVAALGAALSVRSSVEAVTAGLVAQAECRGCRPNYGRRARRGGCGAGSSSPPGRPTG